MEVVVNPLAMESYGLDQAQIISFISLNNRLVAAGSLQSSEGRFPVKVPGVVESAEDILNMPIKAVGERVVHFKDIAEVRRTYKDAESYARLNGKNALAIEVVQRSGANIIETIDDILTITITFTEDCVDRKGNTLGGMIVITKEMSDSSKSRTISFTEPS